MIIGKNINIENFTKNEIQYLVKIPILIKMPILQNDFW